MVESGIKGLFMPDHSFINAGGGGEEQAGSAEDRTGSGAQAADRGAETRIRNHVGR